MWRSMGRPYCAFNVWIIPALLSSTVGWARQLSTNIKISRFWRTMLLLILFSQSANSSDGIMHYGWSCTPLAMVLILHCGNNEVWLTFQWWVMTYRLFGLMGRAWDHLPMAMVILCGRSQVLNSAVALLWEEFFIKPGKVFSTEHAIYSKY